MASTYSNIKIQLMATGENTTTWGDVTNVNLGTAIEEAIVGSADVAFSNANVTLTLTNTNSTQAARNMRLNLTGTATSGYNLIVPAIEKPYIINNGTDGTITVKNSTGANVAVPAGKTTWVYNTGSNVVDAVTHVTSLTLATALPVTSGGTGSNLTTYCNLQANVLGILPAASGGTGANTLTSGYLVKGNGTSAVTASVIYDDGTNVGIGTATPGGLLQLNKASGAADLRLSVAGTLYGNIYASASDVNVFGVTAIPLIFGTSNTERFRIGPVGQWGLSGANYGTSGQVLTSQGASAAPIWSTAASGTVTSVGGTGSVNGLTLTGTVTSSGNLTLGGSITSVATTATINGEVIGYRGIPRSTTSVTAATADIGKVIAVTAGITIPNSTFAAGDAVSIYNDSASSITITAGVTTLRLAGTTTTGNRTLAARGMATVWFNSATEAIISGAGVT